jgi:NADH pyrophosphatase NudC (nudix superfamily)
MFKRLIELRNMLEESVTSLPPEVRNTQIQRAVSFLRSHCAACGDQIDPKDEGNTPICDQCQNM